MKHFTHSINPLPAATNVMTASDKSSRAVPLSEVSTNDVADDNKLLDEACYSAIPGNAFAPGLWRTQRRWILFTPDGRFMIMLALANISPATELNQEPAHASRTADALSTANATTQIMIGRCENRATAPHWMKRTPIVRLQSPAIWRWGVLSIAFTCRWSILHARCTCAVTLW